MPGLNFGEESYQSSANLAMQRNQWNFSLAPIDSTWHYAAAVERYSELRIRVSKPAFAVWFKKLRQSDFVWAPA